MGLGSGIRKKPIPDPGVKKAPDPDPQHCLKPLFTSVADPDPSDSYVFGPPGSGSGFFYQEKIVTLISTFFDVFLTFCLKKMMYM